MTARYRVLSAFLAASMLFSGTATAMAAELESPPVELPTAVLDEVTDEAAEEAALTESPKEYERTDSSRAVTGKLRVTLRLDFDQTLEELKKRQIKAELTGDTYSKTVSLWDAVPSGEDDSITPLYRTGENGVMLIDFTFDGLPQGAYTLKFSGTGYKTFEKTIQIEDYSLYLAVGTGDNSFTIGNLDDTGDSQNAVDEKDLKVISDVLKKETPSDADIARCDLDGDGKVDTTDFAYVSHCVENTRESSGDDCLLLKTDRLTPVRGDVEPSDKTIIVDKNGVAHSVTAAELMDRSTPTSLAHLDGSTISEGNQVSATLDFGSQGIPMTTLMLSTYAGNSTIEEGTVVVEYEDEETHKPDSKTFPIGSLLAQQIPEGVHLLNESGEDVKTITINLGRRVAVKKVTISVSKTSDNKFASVASIEFLEDIIPENPLPANVAVRSLTAEPGNGQVDLKWSALPNITGYEIVSYPTDDPTARNTSHSAVTSASVTGLDNGKEYTFIVTPVSGDDWRGQPVTITSTPQTSKIPDKVDMVSVSAGDGKLTVSWKKVKDADTYTVCYSTDENVADNVQTISAITSTGTVIEGLANDTAYYLYITATNALGTGPRSNIVTGTPQAVTYTRPEGIPTEGLVPREKIASIRLVDANNLSADCKPFNPEYMIDGDYKTHWTAANWSRNEHVEVTFTEPVDLNAAIWVPRLDGNYPKWLRCYAVRVWTNDGKENQLIVPDPIGGGRDDGAVGNSSAMHTWPSVRGNPSSSKFAILPFGPVYGVTKIQVAVEQAGYNLVSLSELMFMEYDAENDVPTKIDALFTDQTFTALKSGVTEEQIAEIEALLAERTNYYFHPEVYKDELALARELLSGESSGVVLDGIQPLTTPSGSNLQPLGVSVNAGKTVAVYADIPEGETVSLYATQVYAEASAWRAPIGTLTSGRNVITVPKIGSQSGTSGGSLYYTYTGSKGGQIKLHVYSSNASVIPMLNVVDWNEIGESERESRISAYLDALKSYSAGSTTADNPKNVTEISTPSVLLSIPASSVPSGATVESVKNTILAWEQIMDICLYTQGFETANHQNATTYRQNVRCMQMFAGAFMYAAGSHIGIGPGSCSGMLTGRPVSNGSGSLFGWGIAHEIGHNMDRLGKAEITNNIYSLMVQTYDGGSNIGTSRLESSSKYEKVFNKVAQQQPGASNDVFVQLGMYWQLHLAYDGADADDPMGFYHEFYQKWKNGDWGSAAQSYDEKFAVVASKTAGKNLTEFFERWGMTLSDAVKTELEAFDTESRAIWYLNDQSRRDRLRGAQAASGSITVTAEAGTAQTETKANQVTLTITPTIDGNIQGYEIRRGSKSIDFVISDGTGAVTYTDTIGSANHRTFEYEVAAYDRLGNLVTTQASTPPEIRIAYDHVVDESAYTYEATADGAVFTAKSGVMQVSGVKLNGFNGENTSFTVTVTDSKGKTYTARQGTITNQAVDDKTSFLTYLQNPSAHTQDSRIWTYDAAKIEITGLTETVTGIQLISYPGDDVAFLESGSVGVLKEDYKYGDGADDVIKAGSLVIAGTFRGAPVYCYVKVKGAFSVAQVGGETGETEQTETVRDVAGESLVFSTLYADEEIGEISDGMFIFVLNDKQEAELQKPLGTSGESQSNCSGSNLLPSRIKVELYRTDTPGSVVNERKTAETLWIHSPGGSELPYIVLTHTEE